MPEVPGIKNKLKLVENDDDVSGIIDPDADIVGVVDPDDDPDSDIAGVVDPDELSLRTAPEPTFTEKIKSGIRTVLPDWINESIGTSKIDPHKATQSILDAETLSMLTGKNIRPSQIYDQQESIEEILKGGKYDTWGQVAGKMFKSLYPAWMLGGSGLVQEFEELMTPPLQGEIKPELLEGYEGPRPFVTTFGEEAADYWGKKLEKQDVYVAPDSLKRYAHMIGVNVMQNIPQFVVGFATGKFDIPLVMMAAQAKGQRYYQARKGGEPKSTASLMSNITFVSEFMTELLPFEEMTKIGVPFAQRLLLSAAFDVPGELINKSIESAVDKVTIRPDMTLGQFAQELIETAVVSLGSVGILTTVAHPLTWAREQHQNRIDSMNKLKEMALSELIKEKDAEVMAALAGQEVLPAEELKIGKEKEKEKEGIKTETIKEEKTFIEPPRPIPDKYSINENEIPENLLVKIKAIRGKTGEMIEYEENARVAYKDVNENIVKYKGLLECLGG